MTWKIVEPFEELFQELPLNSRNHQLYGPRSEDILEAQIMISRIQLSGIVCHGCFYLGLPKQPCFPYCAYILHMFINSTQCIHYAYIIFSAFKEILPDIYLLWSY